VPHARHMLATCSPHPLRPPRPPLAPALVTDRYSTIHVGNCKAVGGLVAVKVYEEAALVAKKRPKRLATREAIVLKYLHSEG